VLAVPALAAVVTRVQILSRARAAAGLSLGEYSALVAAGALSFSDGLKVGVSMGGPPGGGGMDGGGAAWV
jgi:malonyl CoA-acyl carrier protein transacylase